MEKENLISNAKNLRKKVIGYVKWDMDDADYASQPIEMDESDFFGNEALLFALTFVSTSPIFCGINEFGSLSFGNHVVEDWNGPDWTVWKEKRSDTFSKEYLETSRDPIVGVLQECRFMVRLDDYPHSVQEVKFFYVDEKSEIHNVDFQPIREMWKGLKYDEILKIVNLKCLEFLMKEDA